MIATAPTVDSHAGLAELAKALGADRVATDSATLDRYARSSGGAAVRPAAVVWPEQTQQVQAAVEVARRHGLTLHPISRGRNWGYGDACANAAGTVVLDFSRMNRIIEVDEELSYAVIEPGVSQGQLHAYLRDHAPGLAVDCTGAGVNASVAGNALDRGFGHTPYGDHASHTCGMEIVLADGQLLRTGMGRFDAATTTHLYPHGVGPSLDGLFGQSNLGIVTRIGVWLVPRHEAFAAFFVQAPRDGDLEPLLDRLGPLRRTGLLTSAVHIGNDLRVLSGRTTYPWDRAEGRTPLPANIRGELRDEFGVTPWAAGGGIYGARRTVRAIKQELRRRLRGFDVRFLDDRKLARAQRVLPWLNRVGLGSRLRQKLTWIRPVYDLMQGVPGDEPLRGTQWRVRRSADTVHDPLATDAGLMWISPVLPATGRHARAVMDILEPIYHAHGFDPMMTFTMINERALIAVSNIYFDRREPGETERAHACYHRAYDELIAAGYIPYRGGQGGQRRLIDPDSVFGQTTQRIKHALDPQGVISPGRYIPAPVASANMEVN